MKAIWGAVAIVVLAACEAQIGGVRTHEAPPLMMPDAVDGGAGDAKALEAGAPSEAGIAP